MNVDAWAEAWLNNFDAPDRPAAALLLRSLAVVDETTFRDQLFTELLRTVDASAPPVAIYPVWDISSSNVIEPRSSPPLRRPGSEAIVANIGRNVAMMRKGLTLAQPSLSDLRSKRVRTVVFADDYAGSGSRALEFTDAWRRNRTIQSWKSGGYLRLRYVCYSHSTFARQQIEATRFYASVFAVRSGLDFSSAMWTEQERSRIRRLCSDYAHKKELAFGFRSSEGLVVFQHTVPNNIPSVFLQRVGPRGEPWTPLFSRGELGPSFAQVGIRQPAPSTEALKQLTRTSRLPIATASRLRDQLPDVVLLLGLLRGGVRDDEKLCSALGVNTRQLQQLLDVCEQNALCDRSRHLTNRGREEVRASLVRRVRTSPNLIGSDEYYCPRYVRGVGAPI